MRHLLALLLLACSMPALSLTVDSDFATIEDTPLVFSYAELAAKCTVTGGTATGFRISTVSANGTLHIASSVSGPWTTAVVAGATVMGSGQYIRFAPHANLNGNNLLMMGIQATDGSVYTSEGLSLIDITAINDPLTAHSGEFDQAGATVKVTEDTTYSFTWRQLIDALEITEVDTDQSWEIVLTGLTTGAFWTPTNVVIATVDTNLGSPPANIDEVAFKWQAAGDVFTKTGEPAIPVCNLRIRNTNGIINQADVTFATPVLGTSDALAPGDPSYLTSIDPLPVVVDVPRTLTYDEIRNAMHGTNDPDRCGTIDLRFSDAAMAGATVERFVLGVYDSTYVLPSAGFILLAEGVSIRITVPSTTPTGPRTAGTASISSSGSSTYSTPVPLSIQVSTSGGGGGGGGGSGGGGGGCGAGGTVAGLLLVLALPLRRRRR